MVIRKETKEDRESQKMINEFNMVKDEILKDFPTDEEIMFLYECNEFLAQVVSNG
jgi:hypothetical protein